MAINKQLDNLLNKLNKQLQAARLNFGVASQQYQKLAKVASTNLDKYGLTSHGRHVTIKRTNPDIPYGKTINDLNNALKETERYYKKHNNTKARSQMIDEVRKERLNNGETVKQSRRRVTAKEIKQMSEKMFDVDMTIDDALKYLYNEKQDVETKLHPDDAYRRYFEQYYAMAMHIMHRSHKSYAELDRVIISISDLQDIRTKMVGSKIGSSPQGVDRVNRMIDYSINRITQHKKSITNYRNKYLIK